eukprot:6271464-Pyramimonas_sp.AAC.1
MPLSSQKCPKVRIARRLLFPSAIVAARCCPLAAADSGAGDPRRLVFLAGRLRAGYGDVPDGVRPAALRGPQGPP